MGVSFACFDTLRVFVVQEEFGLALTVAMQAFALHIPSGIPAPPVAHTASGQGSYRCTLRPQRRHAVLKSVPIRAQVGAEGLVRSREQGPSCMGLQAQGMFGT
jgi:hypothetical protein